ncbi:MAG: hypothetical protein ACW98D_06720 [Promethearchaeota archaeon]
MALSIEYIIVIHRESQEIIYYKAVGNFDPDFLDIYRSSIHYKILDLPFEPGEIEQATLEGKFLITRACNMIWISIINKNIPTLFSREILKFFGEILEDSYNYEIRDLYSQFEGDISIFKKKSKSKQSIEDIIEDIFHLYLTLPFSIGSIKGKKLKPKSKRIYQLAKALTHKSKYSFYLEKLFYEVGKTHVFNNEDLAELIFDLVQERIFVPNTSEKAKKKYTIHF